MAQISNNLNLRQTFTAFVIGGLLLIGSAAMAAQTVSTSTSPQPPVFALGTINEDSHLDVATPVKEQQTTKKVMPKISARRSDTLQTTPRGRTGTSWLFFRPLWRSTGTLIEAK